MTTCLHDVVPLHLNLILYALSVSRYLCYEFLFKERDQEIEALSTALEKRQSVPTPAPTNTEGLRRSQRRTAQTDVGILCTELEQCRTELLTKTQGAVRVKHCSAYVMVLWYW